jgi:Raf kinase inhibitor-like YbhB/YbcL family protein
MSIQRSFALHRHVPAALAITLIALLRWPAAADPPQPPPFEVQSTAFREGASLPASTAYDGCVDGAANRSPALTWTGAPAGTKSFALSLFDPDAPTGSGFYHWLLFDIPPSVSHLDPGAGDPSSSAAVPGAVSGRVDFGFSHYGGPCPPRGDTPHHYIFSVYALDVERLSGAGTTTTGGAFEDALRGHVLAKATLTGRFGR